MLSLSDDNNKKLGPVKKRAPKVFLNNNTPPTSNLENEKEIEDFINDNKEEEVISNLSEIAEIDDDNASTTSSSSSSSSSGSSTSTASSYQSTASTEIKFSSSASQEKKKENNNNSNISYSNILSLFIILCCYLLTSIISIIAVNDMNEYFISKNKFLSYISSAISIGCLIELFLNTLQSFVNLIYITYFVFVCLFCFIAVLTLKLFNSYEPVDYLNNKFFDFIVISFFIIIGMFFGLILQKDLLIFFIIFFSIISNLNSLYFYYLSNYKGIDWCVIIFISLITLFISSAIYFEKF